MATVMSDPTVQGFLELHVGPADFELSFSSPLSSITDLDLLLNPGALFGLDLPHLVSTWGPLVSIDWHVEVVPAVIPLPPSLAMLGAALLSLWWARRA